jgi:hypothetical protein
VSGGDGEGRPYKVGHGRPPAEHRFQKGKSGNPRGRPRRSEASTPEHGPEPARDIMLREASRLINVMSGGKALTLTAFEAVVKATFVSALNGGPTAQRVIIQCVQAAEIEKAREQAMAYAKALDTKIDLEQKRDAIVSRGGDEWAMANHPSDIEIGPSQEIRMFLALTDEDRAGREVLLDHLATAEAVLKRHAATPEKEWDELAQLGVEIAKGVIRDVNGRLPRRLRSRMLEPGLGTGPYAIAARLIVSNGGNSSAKRSPENKKRSGAAKRSTND